VTRVKNTKSVLKTSISEREVAMCDRMQMYKISLCFPQSNSAERLGSEGLAPERQVVTMRTNRFSILKFCILYAKCIHVRIFHTVLKMSSSYRPYKEAIEH
jgi:hypothetical protein